MFRFSLDRNERGSTLAADCSEEMMHRVDVHEQRK
jgi:hypothetical protein